MKNRLFEIKSLVKEILEENVEEIETVEEVQEEAYAPRPKWQVWCARIALVIFILGLVMYYCNIFYINIIFL